MMVPVWQTTICVLFCKYQLRPIGTAIKQLVLGKYLRVKMELSTVFETNYDIVSAYVSIGYEDAPAALLLFLGVWPQAGS